MTPPTLDEFCAHMALEIGEPSVSGDQHLDSDLEIASVTMVGVLASVEERWGIDVDETDLAGIETVSDLHKRIVSVAQ